MGEQDWDEQEAPEKQVQRLEIFKAFYVCFAYQIALQAE